MTPANIFYVYRLSPHDKGHVESRVIGKFLLENGNFEVLEDHGLPEGLASMPPAQAAQVLHRYTSSMYYRVVNLQDVIDGHHPELIPDASAKQEIDQDLQASLGSKGAEPQSSDFEYDRIGGDGPRKLSVSDGQVFMDNQLLSQDEIDLVKQHVQSGKAFLRRKMAKAESIFQDPMARHLEEDSLVPGVGNLRSYNAFTKVAPPGLHIAFNIHGTRHLNKTHGQEYGDKAIRAVGSAIQNTARQLVGREARVFRLGGDRFVAHVPSTDGAALLARGVRQSLEGIPPVQGTHRLAVSIGIGPSKEHAEWALHDAHGERNRRGYPPGQTKTHAAVRIPNGLNGPIPD